MKLRRFVAALAVLVVWPFATSWAQEHEEEHGGASEHVAQYLGDFETVQTKFQELAGAMADSMYTWRPMEGVRSVSEVFMLIVAENYVVPSYWGAEPPEGMTVDRSLFGSLSEVTDKAEIMKALETSWEYYKLAVASVDDSTLHMKIQLFGEERTVNDLYIVLRHI